ncbi:MAG: hypothetical protein ABR582_01700 [Gemmatimonadaceae bacterium]
MDYRRLTLAAFLALGVRLMFGIMIWMTPFGDQFVNYPTVFRPMPLFKDNVPLMLVGWFIGVFVLAILFAKGYTGGNGALEGFRFGSLMAFFSVGLAVSSHAQFNIGLRMAVFAGAQQFLEMILIGTVIGAAYEPARRLSEPGLVRAA